MKTLFWILLGALVTNEAAQAVTVEQITALINRNPQTGKPTESLEELLPQLPRELRKNFTFIYKSRGPHGGLGDERQSAVDKLHPRTVLFTEDGRLTLAFTGNPDRPGYDTLELIYFLDKERRFELTQFILPAAQKRSEAMSEQASHNGEKNPASCLRCHGQDPRPISDSYPLWPGFYGSVRDTFPKDSAELGWYRKFLKTQRTNPARLYRHLDWPRGTSVPPYLDPSRYNPNKIEGQPLEMKYLPNTRLGMAWTQLNRQRIQRKLEASPRYQSLKYRLLAGFIGCETLPLTQADAEATLATLREENADRIERLGYHPQGPHRSTLDMMEMGFYANAVQLSYLAQALEIDASDWAMAFEKKSLSFFDGILSSVYEDRDYYLKEDFILEMLRELAASDANFRPYFQPYLAYENQYPFGERLDFGAAIQACPTLLTYAAKNGKALPPPPMASASVLAKSPAPEPGRLFQRCVGCHEGPAAIQIGRKIPFSSPQALKVALGENSSSGKILLDDILARIATQGETRMPPHGAPLNENEQLQVKSYLKQLL